MNRSARTSLYSLAVSVTLVGCSGGGGSAVPTTPQPVQRAALSITTMTVAGDRNGSGYSYVVRLTVQNTGTATAVLTSATFGLVFASPGSGTATGPIGQMFASTSVAPGASATAAPVSIDDVSAQLGYASSVIATIGFTDSQGANSTMRTADVPPLPTPPPIGFTLSGTVKEEGGGTPVPGATVVVKDTVRSATSDSNGRYSFAGLSAGRIMLRATKSGYDLGETDVNLVGSTTADISMRKQSNPGPGPSPSPSPGPTPSPGPNGPMCAASSIPSNATCIGNGTPPVTAVCDDGAYSCSATRQGTCSTHGGVRCWVCPGALCNGLTTRALDYTPVPVRSVQLSVRIWH